MSPTYKKIAHTHCICTVYSYLKGTCGNDPQYHPLQRQQQLQAIQCPLQSDNWRLSVDNYKVFWVIPCRLVCVGLEPTTAHGKMTTNRNQSQWEGMRFPCSDHQQTLRFVFLWSADYNCWEEKQVKNPSLNFTNTTRTL